MASMYQARGSEDRYYSREGEQRAALQGTLTAPVAFLDYRKQVLGDRIGDLGKI